MILTKSAFATIVFLDLISPSDASWECGNIERDIELKLQRMPTSVQEYVETKHKLRVLGTLWKQCVDRGY